ncbi:transposase [Streptomyces sp. NPDC057445]|uniref:transposase n=1 Tax=Streptomyces sp. NPDC057445 TaxID=3346136 RepID=UPI003688487C
MQLTSNGPYWSCCCRRARSPAGPPRWARRQLIDGNRFRVRTGIPWRDVPEKYGPWGRVFDLLRRRQRNGTWQRIFTQPQARPMRRT